MTGTSGMTFSLAHSHLEMGAMLPDDTKRLLGGLAGQMQSSALCADQDLGHMEEHLLRGGNEILGRMLEKGAQLKADQAPPSCTVCQNQLSRWKPGHGRAFKLALEAFVFNERAATANGAANGVFPPTRWHILFPHSKYDPSKN